MNFRAAFALTAVTTAALLPAVLRKPACPTANGGVVVVSLPGQAAAKPATPVLVELFTSEGCSSCPPADKLLAQIGAQQPVNGADAIILEEHVDYWDGQGWPDPFASKEATQRQESYAKILHAEVYTPQIIVDGRVEVLGSDERAAQRAIQIATGAPKTDLDLSWVGATATMGGPKLLRVRLKKLSDASASDGKNAEVFLAITENHLHSDVRRGENAGRGLQHEGVVRKLTSLGSADGTGEFSYGAQIPVKLSPDWIRENIRIIVFVQDTRTRRIYAATSTTY
jgi:hypothetical protein